MQKHSNRSVQSVLLEESITQLTSLYELEFPVRPLLVQSEPQKIYR